jgi:hypothetical protein
MEQNKGFWYADWSFPILLVCFRPVFSPGPTCITSTASAHLTKWPSWPC